MLWHENITQTPEERIRTFLYSDCKKKKKKRSWQIVKVLSGFSYSCQHIPKISHTFMMLSERVRLSFYQELRVCLRLRVGQQSELENTICIHANPFGFQLGCNMEIENRKMQCDTAQVRNALHNRHAMQQLSRWAYWDLNRNRGSRNTPEIWKNQTADYTIQTHVCTVPISFMPKTTRARQAIV